MEDNETVPPRDLVARGFGRDSAWNCGGAWSTVQAVEEGGEVVGGGRAPGNMLYHETGGRATVRDERS